MISTTQGIILNTIKYSDHRVIMNIYTKSFGRQAYILNIGKGKKSKNRSGSLQPLYFVELVCYQKETRNVQRIKEIKNTPVFQNIPFDIIKSSQAIFLAEFLSKTLQEQESSPTLFSFIKNSLLYFDLMQERAANFHLWFLIHLTDYLGFKPQMNNFHPNSWFDMRKGTIKTIEPLHPYYLTPPDTITLKTITETKLDGLHTLKLSKRERKHLTQKIIEYYQIHFEHFGEIKSYKILYDIFNL